MMDFENSNLIKVWWGDLLEDGILLLYYGESRDSDYGKGLL